MLEWRGHYRGLGECDPQWPRWKKVFCVIGGGIIVAAEICAVIWLTNNNYFPEL